MRSTSALFGQELFECSLAAPGVGDTTYQRALAEARRMAGIEGIDRLMAEHRVTALIAPTADPAWTIDLLGGDELSELSGTLPAIAGYPHVTVPMGFVNGLPVGLSFIAGAWSDAHVLSLSLAYAYEQRTGMRRAPTYQRSIEDDPAISAAVRPIGPR